jgi:hypothetical protein
MTFDFMSANVMKRAPHHPYSPDLAPCDFYLFDYVKESLAGMAFADREEPLAGVTRISEGIETVIFERVFRSWMDCPARCDATNGEDVEYIVVSLEQNSVRQAQSCEGHESVDVAKIRTFQTLRDPSRIS